MITITEAQLQALQDAADLRLHGVSIQALAELFPEDAQVLGDDGLAAVAQFGVARAARHGFVTRRAVHKYIVLMFIFGSRFDEDPLLSWPAAALADASDQGTRIDRLVADGKAYVAPVAGVGGERYRRALVRALRLPFASFEAPCDRHAERLREVLAGFYPEQSAALTPTALDGALARARTRAQSYDLAPSSGPLVWAMLMIMIGAGFDRDPLHPWAAETLNDPAPDDPDLRSRQLFDRAITRLEEYMAARRARQEDWA